MIGVLGFFCCGGLQEFVAFEGVGGYASFHLSYEISSQGQDVDGKIEAGS